MQELTDILRNATQRIGQNFFRLPIAGSNPIYRERVYCYELYHQMRILWPQVCPFCLNGEVDKRGHEIMERLGAADTIPDLLVHGPGDMGRNHAIIEVKKCQLDLEGIQKDVGVLARFVAANVGYERAIFLIFGLRLTNHRLQQIREEIVRVAPCRPIELWHHSQVGAPAERVPLDR
jgi:hypothetical protein